MINASSILRTTGRKAPVNLYVVFETLLFVVIVVVLLATLAAGANGYAAISNRRSADQKARIGLSLIANSVRISDRADAISANDGPQGKALVLTEHLDVGDFETRIYLHDGWIVEEYAQAGDPYTPNKASQLVESRTFSFAFEDGLLTITTDQGTSQVALRSDQNDTLGSIPPAPTPEEGR